LPAIILLKDYIPEAWKIGGLLIGVYTGGTPNLAAIARGLNVSEDLYILTHTVDLAIGAMVLLFLITGAKGFFGLYLKPYKSTGDYDGEKGKKMVSEFESYTGFFRPSESPRSAESDGVRHCDLCDRVWHDLPL
jgi:uncharacterized membrane protein